MGIVVWGTRTVEGTRLTRRENPGPLVLQRKCKLLMWLVDLMEQPASPFQSSAIAHLSTALGMTPFLVAFVPALSTTQHSSSLIRVRQLYHVMWPSNLENIPTLVCRFGSDRFENGKNFPVLASVNTFVLLTRPIRSLMAHLPMIF